MKDLDDSIQYLKGVGPKKTFRLKRLGLETIEDVFFYQPKEYDDKRKISNLNDGNINEKKLFKVTVKSGPVITRPRRGLTILKIPVEDNSKKASLIWFNQEYLKDRFIPGRKYLIYGKAKNDSYGIQIQNPEFKLWNEREENQGITPIYSLTEGISNKEMMKIVENSMSSYLKKVKNILPNDIINKYGFFQRKEAIKNLHFPESPESILKARNQLAFEELLLLQLGLLMMKNNNAINSTGIRMSKHPKVDHFIKELDFSLTKAQEKVLQEIFTDMDNGKQMNRLVQGDVGSGKTIIGIIAMYNAVLNGYQATMMAPTEILALQHYESLYASLKNKGIKIAFISGNLTKKEKESILLSLAIGEIDIIVGTHALIQSEVKFNKLGIAITDEQHRFGVKQRFILADKGEKPDVMVMTATPIPRTLALILYGDLDISIIDELPPGRQEIKTYAVDKSMKDRIYKFIMTQIDEGRQAYIVCPIIEESEILNVVSAEELYIKLQDNIYPSKKVALLHGKLKQKDKDSIMLNFKNGAIDILVSTTVIEVGVNVPNASIMLIMNAERFGLAQLHQLRGRVGRGEYQSYCILVNDSFSNLSRERMRIMQSINDGFKISEKDLELRGPGEFFGTRQHGIPELKIANLIRDIDILKTVQRESLRIIDGRLWLNDNEYKYLMESVNKLFSLKNDEIMLN